MDRILPFFDPLIVDSFYTVSVDKNRHFLTPSPPHLVHVVIEWPLNDMTLSEIDWKQFKIIWLNCGILLSVLANVIQSAWLFMKKKTYLGEKHSEISFFLTNYPTSEWCITFSIKPKCNVWFYILRHFFTKFAVISLISVWYLAIKWMTNQGSENYFWILSVLWEKPK